MRARPVWLISLVAGLLGLVFAAPVHGKRNDQCQRDPVCREHSDQAFRLYSEKKYEEALKEFQTAYKLRTEPILLLNIGRSMHRLGRPEEAIEQYLKFQGAMPDPDEATQASLTRYMSEAKADVEAKKGTAGTQQQQTVLPPTDPAVTPPPPVTTPPKEDKPVYKKWWFWAIGGAVAVTALSVGLGVGLSSGGQEAYTEFNWR